MSFILFSSIAYSRLYSPQYKKHYSVTICQCERLSILIPSQNIFYTKFAFAKKDNLSAWTKKLSNLDMSTDWVGAQTLMDQGSRGQEVQEYVVIEQVVLEILFGTSLFLGLSPFSSNKFPIRTFKISKITKFGYDMLLCVRTLLPPFSRKY